MKAVEGQQRIGHDETQPAERRAYAKTRTLLTENIDKLHAMSQLLLQYETIDAPQIDAIMEGREPPPPMGWGKSGKDGDNKSGPRPLPPVGGPATQT